MFAANKDRTSLVTDNGPAYLVTEASSLEFPPGNWPQLVAILDDDNEGFLFRKADAIEGDPECGYTYRSRKGLRMVVFND